MGKKPLVGWVGLCGIGVLMTGCCNNPPVRQQNNFAGGRADASAGWTNKALNRQPQNVTAGSTAGGTDSISGMSPGATSAPLNNAGMSSGAWGGGQGMGAGMGAGMGTGMGAVGGMPASGGGSMMPATGAGTPTSYNGGQMQPGGGMANGANGMPGIPPGARYVGSSSHLDITQTSAQMSDASALTNAGGSRPTSSVDGGVRPAMATSSDLNSLSSLPPPPTGGAGSSGNWNSSGAIAPPPPSLPSDPALSNSPPPVSSMSTRGLSGPSTATPGSSNNSLGSYLNSKGP